jgi:DNA-binding transcriptional MerR regulator
MTEEFTIEDLEKHSRLPVRTIYYYMQEGRLPGPDKRGKYATYSQEHLDRLDLILILKEMHLPLREIRTLLESMTPAEIQHYRDDQEDLLDKLKAAKPDGDQPASDSEDSSALAYIKSLEEAHGMIREIRNNNLYFSKKLMDEDLFQKDNKAGLEKVFPKPQEERWRRVVLVDGIELHTRETRDKDTLYKISRLLSFAQSLFGR